MKSSVPAYFVGNDRGYRQKWQTLLYKRFRRMLSGYETKFV